MYQGRDLNSRPRAYSPRTILVPEERFELSTSGLWVPRSNQLSYPGVGMVRGESHANQLSYPGNIHSMVAL